MRAPRASGGTEAPTPATPGDAVWVPRHVRRWCLRGPGQHLRNQACAWRSSRHVAGHRAGPVGGMLTRGISRPEVPPKTQNYISQHNYVLTLIVSDSALPPGLSVAEHSCWLTSYRPRCTVGRCRMITTQAAALYACRPRGWPERELTMPARTVVTADGQYRVRFRQMRRATASTRPHLRVHGRPPWLPRGGLGHGCGMLLGLWRGLACHTLDRPASEGRLDLRRYAVTGPTVPRTGRRHANRRVMR